MGKIKVTNSIVEMIGDEMTRIIWQQIKSTLLLPFLELNLRSFDLSIQSRDKSNNQITLDAVKAIKEDGIGVKCATITADNNRQKEFNLKQIWPSPNGTIRNAIGGAIFREPIICKNITPLVRMWKKPIVVSRHAFGDQYKPTELEIPGPGKLSLKWEDSKGVKEYPVSEFSGKGVALAIYNLDRSIEDFAEITMSHSYDLGLPLYLSTKNTILKHYDNRFVDIFEEVYKKKFNNKIDYQHRLIDDMAAFTIRSEGGFVWACKNYDGDVQSDLIAQGYGSLGMMTSILISPNKEIVTEAAHGTVTRHYRLHQKGEKTSTNPTATIFAWTKALYYRGKKDKNRELVEFSQALEQATIQTIEQGDFTKDLATVIDSNSFVTTDMFLSKIKQNLKK